MKTFLSLVAVLLLTAFAAHTLWLWWNGELFDLMPVTQQEIFVPIVAGAMPDGHLFLTLQMQVGEALYPTLYQFSQDDGLQLRATGLTGVSEAVAPDLVRTAFVAYPSTAFQETYGIDGSIMQVMVSNESGTIVPVTRSDTPRKLMPVWSPDGTQIAFMASSSSEAMTMGAPEVWNIFVTNMNGEEQMITSGAYPRWSPEGDSLRVLKESGIVDVNLTTLAETTLYANVQPLTWGNVLTSDRTGNRLILTFPSEGRMAIFQSRDALGSSLIKDRDLFVGANSAVFSPDGSVIAAVTQGAAGQQPALHFINTATAQILESVPLTNFANTPLIATDWIPATEE